MSETKQTGDVATAETKKGENVGVRLDAALLARVDATRARMAARVPGMSVSRSNALRALILAGLGATDGQGVAS